MEKTTGTLGSEFVWVPVGPDMARVLADRVRGDDFDLLYELAGREPGRRATPEDLMQHGALSSAEADAWNGQPGGVLADGNLLLDTRDGWVEMQFPSGHCDAVRNAMELVFSMLGRQESAFRLGRLFQREILFPDMPECSALVPYLSYYTGDTAILWAGSGREGARTLNDFEKSTPPDLVVEVERSGGAGDAARMEMYRRLGIVEMWIFDNPYNTRPRMTMMDLQAPGGPQVLRESAVLPGVTGDFAVEALLAAAGGEHRKVIAVIGEHGVGLSLDEEAAPSP